MRKIGKYILVIVLCMICSITLVKAKNYTKDLFQTGDNLKIEKELEGTSFLAGREVKINNKIKGIGFIAGEEIKINDVQEYLFLIGNNVDLDADIKNDLFVFGENVRVNKSIKRDAYLAGTTIVLNGNVARNTYIYGTTVEIKGTIKGNININAVEIKIDKDAKILGTFKYNEDATIKGDIKNIETKTYKLNKNYSISEYIISFITSFISITSVGLVLMYILKDIFKKSLKEIKNKKYFISLLGKGFLILIGTPIISLTLLMTGLFTSLGTILIIIYGLLIYISEIFVAYILSNLINKKWLNKNINEYMLIIIGIFIVRVLSTIPIIGGFITFVVLLLGLGIIGNLIIQTKK